MGLPRIDTAGTDCTLVRPYVEERLAICDALLEGHRSDIVYGRVWTLEPGRLRFKHGETIAELKVPYHLGADDEAVVEGAMMGLTRLLKTRFEPDCAEDVTSAPAPGAPVAPLQPLKDRAYLTNTFIEDSLEKRIASEILVSTPAVDASILSTWLCPGGQAARFIKWVDHMFEKALKDEAKGGWEEPTSHLALLAFIRTAGKKKALLKDVRIKGLSYEKLDHAVGISIFVLFREALASTLRRLKATGVSYYRAGVDFMLRSSVVPKSFLAIPGNLLSGSLNPYALNSETYEAILPYGGDFIEGVESSSRLVWSTLKRVKERQEVMEAVKLQHDINRFRRETLTYLMEFDLPGSSSRRHLHELYAEDRLIKSYLASPKLCGDLAASLEGVRKRFANNPKKALRIAEFQKFLASFKKSRLSGLLWSGRTEETGELACVIEAFCAHRFDEHVERFEGLMRGYLADRRKEFDGRMLKEEYAKGRLYRFSADDRPVLNTLELAQAGQLFIDMKDFTRKTLKVKEIAMADFMKEYFYRPILNAAGRYGAGTGVAADERGITLTNLPGDAAIFSGGVTSLVRLGSDIQRIIRRYRENLEKRLPPKKAEELIEEVHKRFDRKRAELKARREKLNAALNRDECGLEDRLIALGEEEHRLDNTYREELEASIKGELEAGLYISYGAKAETMVIDTARDFTGPVKVAIGEKINESARGTYRNSLVRTKHEILLESERKKRKNPGLRYPFQVFIERIYSLRMPQELEAPFEKLITRRKPAAAEAMTKIMAAEFLRDLKKITAGETFSSLRLVTATTDIYNKGQAISQEALDAYMRENRGTKEFFKKVVEVGKLDMGILDAFFFPFPELEIWFGVEVVKGATTIEAFARIGEVIFKGFEGNNPIVIYEMLNPEDDFFKALVKHHLGTWIEEARNPARKDDF